MLNILNFMHLEMSQGQWTSPVVLAVFFFKHDSVQTDSRDSQDIGKDAQIKDATDISIKKKITS